MGAPQNFGVPFNISVFAEASKFGIELGFAKSNCKTTFKDKCGPGIRLGASEIYFFNIYAMAENSDFQFSAHLWFAN